MAGIPEQEVLGRIENPMKGKGQFDNTQIRSEVAAVLANRRNDEVTNLPGQLLELGVREPSKVLGGGDSIEKHAPATLPLYSPVTRTGRPPFA